MTVRPLLLAPLTAMALLLGWAPIGASAQAETRSFGCGKGRTVTLASTSPNSIAAILVGAKAMELLKSDEDPLLYIFGGYSVRFSSDLTKIAVAIPDTEGLNCVLQQGASHPAPGCAEGEKMVGGLCKPIVTAAPVPRCDAGSRPDPAGGGCVPVGTGAIAGRLPMPGRSRGGVVRSAPNPSAARLGALAPNDPVTIVAAMNTVMDGYDWFKIEVGGRAGYQWGGALCSDAALSGVFAQCQPRR